MTNCVYYWEDTLALCERDSIKQARAWQKDMFNAIEALINGHEPGRTFARVFLNFRAES
ncbi:hypothetical protein BDV10DRAFT_173223 [Aspergillus recurvatus]